MVGGGMQCVQYCIHEAHDIQDYEKQHTDNQWNLRDKANHVTKAEEELRISSYKSTYIFNLLRKYIYRIERRSSRLVR